MNQEFKNVIDQYRNGELETQNLQICNQNFQNLQICNQNFSNESIFDEFMELSSFINVNFLDFNFTAVDFASSFFNKCSFKNCIFDRTLFRSAEFENCSLKNCNLKNCNLINADLRETTFDKCCFENNENDESSSSSLAKAWFESCHFIETNFTGFDFGSLIQTSVVDSKFSKFDKSIEFKGEFFLLDILQPGNGLEGMFIE